jgi:hypothetical protein
MNCWSHINENYLLNPTSICLYHFCIWLLLQHWKHNEQWQFRSDKWRTVDCFSLVPLISTPEILACCERFQRDANANDFSVMRTRTILAWCERERFCWHNYFLLNAKIPHFLRSTVRRCGARHKLISTIKPESSVWRSRRRNLVGIGWDWQRTLHFRIVHHRHCSGMFEISDIW